MDHLENILENEASEEVNISEELLETLSEISYNELNINNLSYNAAVLKLHLTDYQYYQLQLYIENYGQLVSLYEIAVIPGFSKEDIPKLQEWVVVKPMLEKEPFFKDFFKRSKNNLLIRYGQVLEQQAGYDPSSRNRYEGSPGHACFKYSFSSKDKLFIKISGEKDAGECFFRGKQKYGFDFYSGSICLKDVSIIKNCVIGDYRIGFGQGLVMGSSLMSGKGGDVNSIRLFSSGIRAIAPTNEGDFLRGTAITIGNTTWSGTLFGGRQFGTLDNHYGGDITYSRALFQIGARFVIHTQTDTNEHSFSQLARSTFVPQNFNIGLDYKYIIKSSILFGEIAIDRQGHLGILQKMIFNVTPTTTLGVVFRHYDIGFSNPLGNAFGANSHNDGETGLYLIGNFIAGSHCELRFFADYYRLNWLSYRTDAPIQAIDLGLTTQYNLTRNSNLEFQYTFRSKPENDTETIHYKVLREHQRHKIQLQWNNNPYPILKLKTGVKWVLNLYPLKKEHFQGLLLYQDIELDFKKTNCAIHLRVAYFDTDRYDERLYAYEDDVYYAFTIGSYYYKGIKGYLVLRYKYKFLTLWLRLAQTYYIDRRVISSGLNQINAPHKTELKAQMMFSF